MVLILNYHLTICWTKDVGKNKFLSYQSNKKSHKSCIHFVCKNCTRCIQQIYTEYTKCIENLSHILTKFCIHFILYTKIKRTMAAKLCKQNINKSLLECGMYFAYILYIFCIHQFWSTKSVYHKNHAYILFTKFIQNVYTNNCVRNGSHISICVDPFVCTSYLIIANN